MRSLCAGDSARYNVCVERTRKGKPPRLDRIYQSVDAPLFFVTFNTHARRPLLAREEIHSAFAQYCVRASDHHIAVGRYVLMPEHIHLFIRFGAGATADLSTWTKGLKRHLEKRLVSLGAKPFAIPSQKLNSFWQPGFHDHLPRSAESYAQKWDYVRENPVRGGLVRSAGDWPYAGEIVIIDRF